MKASLLILATCLLSLWANATTWTCKPHEVQEGFSDAFLTAALTQAKELSIDLKIAELDVYGSCGAENIGKFTTAKGRGNTVSGSWRTGAVQINKHYQGLTAVVEETLTYRVVSEQGPLRTVEVSWQGDCVEFSIRNVVLDCVQK